MECISFAAQEGLQFYEKIVENTHEKGDCKAKIKEPSL